MTARILSRTNGGSTPRPLASPTPTMPPEQSDSATTAPRREGGPALQPAPQGAVPWASASDAVVAWLGVDPAAGLSDAEAEARLARYGPNRLRAHPRRSAWRVLADQVRSLIIALLAVATGVAFAFGETLEAYAILAVIVLTVGIGFVTELRAVRAMEALFALGRVTTRVRRGGRAQEVAAEALVPGDVVVIEAGDVVTADLRLVEASKVQADESAMTGESVPVSKGTAPVAADAPLAERPPMLYKGTAVTRGAGLGVVTATGMATELGAISALVAEADDGTTPLEARLARLGRRLIGLTLAVAAFVTASGVLAGKDLVLMIQTGIALAVAAVPEGLPVVATLALARGVHRMARRNALLNRLASVETLGSTGVILTDKTGTLTENRMTVTRLMTAGGAVTVTGEGLDLEGDLHRDGATVDHAADAAFGALVDVGVLCNDATLEHGGTGDGVSVTGDPMEVALLVLGAKTGRTRDALLARQPEVREEAFDPDVKMMATVHDTIGDDTAGDRGNPAEGHRYRYAVKGGPGAVLAACTALLQPDGTAAPLTDADRAAWLDRNRALARDGLRVLAAAVKTAPTPDAPPYAGLTFVGLWGIEDPPREGVREALTACRAAGIEVVMVTGDQPATALGVGRAVGLVDGDTGNNGTRDDSTGDDSTEVRAVPVLAGPDLDALDLDAPADRARALGTRLFARVTPRQKLALIALHQDAGHVVAMTGDGVNDAPALKQADIGVAMGQRGTQVAREAADMVLQDDAFATIVAAVREGRVIFGNIRRFAFYLLSCNVSEVMVVGLAAALGMTLPLLPLQILFLNLVTDVLPALALGVGEGDARVMERPPRRAADPILHRRHWGGIAAYGALITGSVLGALYVAEGRLGLDPKGAVTVSFLTLAFAQLWHVFNMRARGSGVVANEVTRNPYVWVALAACTLILLTATYLPPLAAVLGVAPPDAVGWGLILGMSALPVIGRLLIEQVWGGRCASRGAARS